METANKSITTENHILGIIQKVRELQAAIRAFETFPFLNPTQKAAIHETDLEFYVHCLPPKQRKALFDPDNSTIDIPCEYKRNPTGRYVLVDGKLEWYDANKHNEDERMALDEEMVKLALQEHKKKAQTTYWNTALYGIVPPKVLIPEIDIIMRPHLPFIKEHTDLDIKQAILDQSPATADSKKLDDVLHELLCVQEVARQLYKDKPEQTVDFPETPPRENKKPDKLKQKPLALLQEVREEKARDEFRRNPDITAEKLGEKLGCHKSTVTRLKAWKKNQERKRPGQKPPNGFKRDRLTEGPDTEAITNGPQAEHRDIKQMYEDYNTGASSELPTTQTIASKLSLSEKQAEEMLRETQHFFPDAIIVAAE
jgi:hypothetical protein